MDLDKINYELNIQKSNLLLLKEYLNKMNNLIQEDDSYDNSFKFMEMLKELKINMDNVKTNISNLTVLRSLLINLQIQSESESSEEPIEDIQSNSEKDLNAEQITVTKEDIKDDNSINQDIEPNITPIEKEILEELKGEIKDDIDKDLYAAFFLESDKEEKPESDKDSSMDLEDNIEDEIEDDIEDNSEEIRPNKKKSQKQIVVDYYEECFETLEKNFVVFYAFLLNYINSCTLSEEYYLSELSKEKQNAIEFIQNELMEKEPSASKEKIKETEKTEEVEKVEEVKENEIPDEKQVKDKISLSKKVKEKYYYDDEEDLEEMILTSKSNTTEDDDDNSIGTLIISEKDNKVILPYNEDDIKKILDTTSEYTSLEQIIDEKFTIPLDKYKNPALSRFRETYNLMKKRQKASMADSLDLALELAFNSSLNPAVITACKNLEQLDSYLTCVELNEVDKFEYFRIKYEVSPLKK